MNTFTIKDIEHLTGIKSHTIRVWEQRYRLFQPKRKDTNHRIYDGNDLKFLLCVASLYHSGVKISRIANMGQEEIRRRIHETQEVPELYLPYVNQLIEAMLDFDQPRFEKVFRNLEQRAGLEKSMICVVYPFLEKAGLLWMTGNVMPSQKHFATNIIRQKLLTAIDGLEQPADTDEHFLLFLPEGEFHEIPLLFVQYMLKKHRRPATSFGANVPLEDVQYFVQRKQVTHLYTHMATNFTKRDLNAYVAEMIRLFPQMRIILSGMQARLPAHPLPSQVQVLHSLDDIVKLAANR